MSDLYWNCTVVLVIMIQNNFTHYFCVIISQEHRYDRLDRPMSTYISLESSTKFDMITNQKKTNGKQ